MSKEDKENLTIRLLGPVEVRLDDVSIAGGMHNKMLALLAYLAIERRPHTREHLADLLWPDLAADAARSNLRVTLYRLGQAFRSNKDFLQMQRDTVSLSPASNCRLDVTDFLAPLAGDASASAMESRVRLYRGGLLDGLSFEAGPAFSDWLTVKREACHRHALALLDTLISKLEKAADFKAALRHAHRLLELEPWSEHGHRLMMSLLAQDGQEEAALAQYGVCERMLEKELGTSPAAQTVALFERIKAGKLRPEVAKPYRLPFLGQAPAHAPRKPLNVLIVDDHLLFRVGLTLMLQALGPDVTVFEATSCEAALALSEPEQGFDIILLDIRLPGTSGIDGLGHFRRRYPATPVMLCSAEEDMAVIRTALACGAQGYLSKALDAGTTMAAIDKVLDGGLAFPAGVVGREIPKKTKGRPEFS